MSEIYYGYRFLLMAFILAANAFFAGAEVSLVSVRPSRLRELAGEGNAGAQAALILLANPQRLLSVTQVGVTLASLALGWAGEDTLYHFLIGLINPALNPATERALHVACFAVAFLLMTFCHVVIGEVVPKNLGIEKADRLAVLVAPALLVFSRVSRPFVFVLERSSAAVSRVAGLHGEPRGGGHSPEELKLIISSSRREGSVRKFEESAIHRLLDLQDLSVREIMVPRNDIVRVSLDAPLDEILRTMAEHQYSRVPVFEDSPERIVGFLHSKDLLKLREQWRAPGAARRLTLRYRLRPLLRKPLVVPETKPLNQMIDEFRQSRSHMAVVVDEFGTIVGMVTLEDVLEQVFGEIEDEHDVARQLPARGAPVVEVEGTTPIRDLETQYGIELPADAGFETLAGFILFRLGSIPKPGDAVEHGARRYLVTEMDRNRIARVRIERVAPSQSR